MFAIAEQKIETLLPLPEEDVTSLFYRMSDMNH
ncbi:unnamed protein product [Nezara viridula]|uniref:Uncharacterized protein n=1 Tax=Nezara viridula TaxID=85310 RepID=A0A9P0E6X8_NEZVI|nr:unnamed protein product [Nezara viridula]